MIIIESSPIVIASFLEQRAFDEEYFRKYKPNGSRYTNDDDLGHYNYHLGYDYGRRGRPDTLYAVCDGIVEWSSAGSAFGKQIFLRSKESGFKEAAFYAHCFPPGTLVGGSVPSPIETAEEVLSHDGRLHKVTEHLERPYVGDLIRIRTTGALPLRATPEHPIWVVREGEREWIEASQVRRGDYLISPRPRFSADPIFQQWLGLKNEIGRPRIEVSPLIPDADTAWMLGLYAADGSTDQRNGITFTLSMNDDVDRLIQVWETLGISPRVERSPNFTRVRVASRTVAESFRTWFQSGTNKRLPSFLFEGWPVASIVEGLVEGDGYVRRNGSIIYTSISLVLLEQLRTLLLMLRESPLLRPVKRYSGYPNANPTYTCEWRPYPHRSKTLWWKDLYLMPVREIVREPYAGMVHNLHVAEAETYTVNGAAVHNCESRTDDGKRVNAGAAIGRMGTTGGVPEHLHFSWLENWTKHNTWRNPGPQLRSLRQKLLGGGDDEMTDAEAMAWLKQFIASTEKANSNPSFPEFLIPAFRDMDGGLRSLDPDSNFGFTGPTVKLVRSHPKNPDGTAAHPTP